MFGSTTSTSVQPLPYNSFFRTTNLEEACHIANNPLPQRGNYVQQYTPVYVKLTSMFTFRFLCSLITIEAEIFGLVLEQTGDNAWDSMNAILEN